MKNITLFFENLNPEHLGKDPILVPYYLGKLLNCSVSIVYPKTNSNSGMPPVYKGMNLIPIELSSKTNFFFIEGKYLKIYKYIWNNARNIDYFMRFFHCDLTEVSCLIYKFRNPQGKIYVKMDKGPINIKQEEDKRTLYRYILHQCRRLIDKWYFKSVDVITCETSKTYDMIMSSKNSWYQWGRKLSVMENGFDEELLGTMHIKERSFSEKENVMITVARLGTPPKNTEFLLQVLANIDLKDWKFYLIGPIEEKFKKQIDLFYEEHPDKIDNVIFSGAVTDKRELWEFYNRSKVFVLTSRYESSGLVFYEAKRFKNYVVSTAVGAIDDIIDEGKYGCVFEQNDTIGLANILQSIVDGTKDIEGAYLNYSPQILSWENRLTPLSQKLVRL